MKREGEIQALEARLARSWREPHGPELGEDWKAGVMDAVRAEAARAAAGASTERFVRNAFLAAAAAAVLAAVVGSRAGLLDPSTELGGVLASDPHGLLQLVLVM